MIFHALGRAEEIKWSLLQEVSPPDSIMGAELYGIHLLGRTCEGKWSINEAMGAIKRLDTDLRP